MDLKEDFTFSLLHFKEVCGYNGKVGVAECIRKMCARARESNIKLKVESYGEVCMYVYMYVCMYACM